MPKIVTIHQPEHLPWLGFFAKMDRADLFISLDTVPFRKNYFQNRNRVLGFDGEPLWLTVPVRLDEHLDGRIADVGIAEDGRWRRKYLGTLRQRYAKHPHADPLIGEIAGVIEGDYRRLRDLNEDLIRPAAAALGVDTPSVRASELGGEGVRSELLADLCRRAKADVYLSGPSGRDYLDVRPFRDAGIEVWVHDYSHPEYPQKGGEPFVSHLAAVDLLANHGAQAGEIMRTGSRIGEL
jgi:hypothetical protein